MNKHKFSIQQGDPLAFAIDTGIDIRSYTGTMPVYDRNGTLLDTIGLTFRLDNFIDGTADTSDWPVGKYKYYLRVTSPGGVFTDFLQGDICVG